MHDDGQEQKPDLSPETCGGLTAKGRLRDTSHASGRRRSRPQALAVRRARPRAGLATAQSPERR